jgi:hypothetical protein
MIMLRIRGLATRATTSEAHKRDGDGLGEKPHIFAGDARHEQHGQKGRHGRQGGGDHRHGNFGSAFDNGGDTVLAQLVVMIDVFHHDNGIVHDHADAQHQREADHVVVGHVEDL